MFFLHKTVILSCIKQKIIKSITHFCKLFVVFSCNIYGFAGITFLKTFRRNTLELGKFKMSLVVLEHCIWQISELQRNFFPISPA